MFSNNTLYRNFVGFDNFLRGIEKELSQNTNFPPYNVIQYGDDKFKIELAIAGYSKEDITITVKDNKLVIVGDGKENCASSEDGAFLHKGIAKRNFTRSFILGDHFEIEGASYSEGILTITLTRVIPEENKPRIISIS